MTTNELIERLKTIEEKLMMKPDDYIEMINKKFESNRPLRSEDVYPYKVGTTAAEISFLIDDINNYGIEEVNRNE